MSTELQSQAPERESIGSHRVLRWDRLVVGLLLSAGGVGWLLHLSGVPVPWQAAPAAALIVTGVALLLSLAGGAEPSAVTVVLDLGVGDVEIDHVPA